MKKYMRLIICVILTLSLLFCTVGCSPALKPGAVEFSARYFFGGDLDEDSEYRGESTTTRTDIVVIRSRSELEKFIKRNMTERTPCEVIMNPSEFVHQHKQPKENYKSFAEFGNKYDAKFFKDNYLVFIFTAASSCCNSYRIDNVTVTANKQLHVTISQVISQSCVNYEDGTYFYVSEDAAARWAFLLEIDRKSGIANNDQIVLEVDTDIDIYKDVY